MSVETRYTKVGDIHLAYQIVGTGPVDLVHIPGIFSHLEWQWEGPAYARYLRRLAGIARLILFDVRGLGLSDRSGELPILEQQMDDLVAVLDAAGSERAVMYGVSQGGPMAALFAATHPTRTSGLILYGSYAAVHADATFPWGRSPAWIAEWGRQLDETWGTGKLLSQVAPTSAEDDAFRDWWARLERLAAGPGNALEFARINTQVDIRDVLPAIRAPTLVLQRRGDTYRDPGNARYLAEHIPDARLVELPGIDHLPFIGNVEAVLAEIEAFVSGSGTGDASEIGTDRELATVLFVDVVGSTERAATMGDRAWSDLLDRFFGAIRRELARHRGSEVDTAGDGLLARFDGPARAVRCAVAIRTSVEPLGLRVRAGLHTGEVELADGTLRGIAVHVGSRVSSIAGPGEILVSSTVRDLIAGSGITLQDRGEHELKGVPDRWRVFAVADG
jgi:class 3 adenylate cyclase/pimeloyl-ACP methyl ester carboxylesterase